MKSMIQKNALFSIVCVAFAMATIAFLTHDLFRNQQSDTQGIRYAVEWLQSMQNGTMWQWITELPARKYPMLYVAPFTLVFGLMAALLGPQNVTFFDAQLAARLVTLLFSLGTIFFLVLTARLLKMNVTHVLLLLFSSMLFFLFATAIRPHGAVACWTIGAYYFALRYQKKQSPLWMHLSYLMAALAFSSLQSGLFAFLFPVWATIVQEKSWKMRGVNAMHCVFFFVSAAVIGYPFLLHGMLFADTGVIDTSLGHDIPFQFLPQIMPGKFWALLISETILCVFAVIGTVTMMKRHRQMRASFTPVFWYLALFYGVFLMQVITSTRFHLPTFPFLALLGAYAFAVLPKATRTILSILLIAVYAQCAVLGFRSGTLEEASAFLSERPGMIQSNLPPYFFLLPPERFTAQGSGDPASFAILSSGESPASMQLCATFTSSISAARFAENGSPFLWNAVEWPLVFVFQSRAIGPNLRVYCASDSLH